MGGSGSHQFTVPCATGEDVIVYTEDGHYAANIEKAAVDPLPCADATKTAEIAASEEVHTPATGSIDDLCALLKITADQTIKTLIYQRDDEVVAALLRGDHELNPEKLTQALGGRSAEPALPDVITKVTGAAVGFAGPMGLDGKVTVFIDPAVAAMTEGVAGANKTDYHMRHIVPGS